MHLNFDKNNHDGPVSAWKIASDIRSYLLSYNYIILGKSHFNVCKEWSALKLVHKPNKNRRRSEKNFNFSTDTPERCRSAIIRSRLCNWGWIDSILNSTIVIMWCSEKMTPAECIRIKIYIPMLFKMGIAIYATLIFIFVGGSIWKNSDWSSLDGLSQLFVMIFMLVVPVFLLVFSYYKNILINKEIPVINKLISDIMEFRQTPPKS